MLFRSIDKQHDALLNEDRLKVGGLLYLRYWAYQRDERDWPQTVSPNLLDVYFDARPSDRVRAYVRGRLDYDPTGGVLYPELLPLAEQAPDTMDVSGYLPRETSTCLDQMWLAFDVERTVFVTVGKQPVKWGATRIWNPVDFVNRTRRDPLNPFDSRLGIQMLKLQVPGEGIGGNVVGLAIFDQAAAMDDVAGAMRIETAFSTAELGLTAYGRKGDDPRFGLDLSAGVWELDMAAELGVTVADKADHNTPVELGDKELAYQASAGATYMAKYGVDDFFVIAGEYFYNPDGMTDSSQYADAFLAGSFQPFYLGRHYAGLVLSLPGPGSFDHTTFSLSTLSNLSDRTYISRFDFSTQVLTWISLEAFVAAHLGDKGGEFRFWMEEIRLPGTADYEPPLVPALPYQMIDFGIGLRVDI